MEKSPEELYRYYRLCGKHFETTSVNTDTPNAELKDDAVPTVFDGPNQSHSGQAKRGRDSTKDNETKTTGRKRVKKSEEQIIKEEMQDAPDEEEYKQYLKTLFEVLLLLGEQNIPPTRPTDGQTESSGSSNFQALLEYAMVNGDEVLKKRHNVNNGCCSAEQLQQLIETCEKSIRSKLVQEVKENGFFSLLTDDPVKISGKCLLPVFLRYVDQSNYQRERFVGFLSFEGDVDDLAGNLLSELEGWDLDMEQCRGQAHSFSAPHFKQTRAFAAKVIEKYPRAVISLRSTHALNVTLAGSMSFPGVQLVMSTFRKIEAFFSQSPLLQADFEDAISIFYPDKEEKVNELKEICRTKWTRRQDAFEVALEIIEALLLCVDSVHDNEDMRWTDQVTHNALEISQSLTDFEFIIALVVLKNVMTLTRALGNSLQGSSMDIHFAASTIKAVTQSLKEVSENIDVYHEFWNDEAVNLATTMEVPVKVPRSFSRKHQMEARTLRPESFYKEHLSVPLVNHVLAELTRLFSQDHLMTLRCLSLVPAVIEQYKSTEPEEACIHVFNSDIPNAGTLSAELHCWWVKWSKKGKDETFASNVQETLQVADVKFFPNMLAVLRLVSITPTLALQESSDVAFRRFKTYMETMPDKLKSKSLAVLNLNHDVGLDVDSLVETHAQTYPDVTNGSSTA
ncbi:52 kDa repressor of the inhibitor of the protein kinase-like isoform X2 [Salarias fasciatus]|nr:52 kDa repressor of the inhibitor of the protein kinase-like isoform X2 [Salarias fasciatus]